MFFFSTLLPAQVFRVIANFLPFFFAPLNHERELSSPQPRLFFFFKDLSTVVFYVAPCSAHNVYDVWGRKNWKLDFFFFFLCCFLALTLFPRSYPIPFLVLYFGSYSFLSLLLTPCQFCVSFDWPFSSLYNCKAFLFLLYLLECLAPTAFF